MNIDEAIKVLKNLQAHDRRSIIEVDRKAIDTVVSELEKDVIMEDKLMMILRQLYDHKINIIEAFNRITVREEAKADVISSLSDEHIDSIIYKLDEYARNYNGYEYGLPTYDEHIENMRILVKQFLNGL